MKESYSKAITDASLRELEEFASWYNRIVGNHPIIVGGWAVHCYTGGLGSKDIDVVFLGDRVKHGTLFPYFAARGYSESRKNLMESQFTKTVTENGGELEIVIDASSSNRTNIFEGKKARLPWSWAVKHSRDHRIAGAVIQIPEIELLLAYKLGAVLGRNISFRTGVDPEYYRGKLWKDVYDVSTLAARPVDKSKLQQFLKESRLDLYAQELLTIVKDNLDDELRSLLPPDPLTRIEELLTGGSPLTTKTPGAYNPR